MCPREEPVLWDGGKAHYLSEPSLGLLTNMICAKPRWGNTTSEWCSQIRHTQTCGGWEVWEALDTSHYSIPAQGQ